MPGECAPRAVARTPTTEHRHARLLARAAAPITSSVIGGGDLLRLLLSRPRRPRHSLTEREREREREWGLNLDTSVGPLMGAACSPCCPRRRTPRHRYSVSRLLDLPDLLHANSVTSDKRFETILEVASERRSRKPRRHGATTPPPPRTTGSDEPRRAAAARERTVARGRALRRGSVVGLRWVPHSPPRPHFCLSLSLSWNDDPTDSGVRHTEELTTPTTTMDDGARLGIGAAVVRCCAVSPRVARVAHVRCCCTSCCTRRA